MFGVIDLIYSKWNVISKWIERKASKAADKAMDEKRDEYECLLREIV